MRLTNVSYAHHIGHAFKVIWKRRAKFVCPPVQIPSELQAMGVKVHDILDVVRNKTVVEDADLISSGSDTFPDKKYYLHSKDVQVEEGESHVLVLTKTLLYEELPKVIKSIVGIEQLPNQDKLVQDSLLAACVLDSRQDRLPRRKDPELPRHNFRRDYGITNARKGLNLANNISSLAEMASGKFPLIQQRSRTMEAHSEIVLNRKGDTIVFQNFSDIVFTSKVPLKPFASEEEVRKTEDMDLPSIYPVKPTVDLWQCDSNPCLLSNMNDPYGSNVKTFNYLHTLHIVNPADEVWLPMQELCRALVTCFTFAAEEAHKLYGENVKVLPSPVSVQCTYWNAQSMGVAVYQLNTLDLEHDEGVKNQVWVQEPKRLYSQATELHGLEEYNPDAFPDALALHLNGVHPASF